jgi:hypothetical protein
MALVAPCELMNADTVARLMATETKTLSSVEDE